MITEKESRPGHYPGQSWQMDQEHSENPNKHSLRNEYEKDSVRGGAGKRLRVRSPWYASPLTCFSVNVDNWNLNRAHWRGRKLGPLTNAFATLLSLLLGPLMWQACHNLAFTVVLRGRRGTHGTGWRAWTWLRRAWRRANSAWQAWHKLRSTVLSCVFATAAGVLLVSALDGGQVRVSRPDNETCNPWRREPEVWPNVGRSVCRCVANRHLSRKNRDACVFLNCAVTWHLWKNLHS